MMQERLEFTKRLAVEAGRLTLEGHGKCGQMPKDAHDGGYDIATIFDLSTEELVKRRILEQFGDPVLGEEDGLIGDPHAAEHALWIVDPIDGTFNYQRGLPLYAVSIAFCLEGVPACGAIFLPVLDQLFFAANGSGAFLIDRDAPAPVPITVSQERDLPRLIISLAGGDIYKVMAACAKQNIPWRSLRLSLCAVASLAFVASGRADIFSDTALSLWDVAAGDIILREAGGSAIVDYVGRPIFPEYVHRRLRLAETAKFPCIAASSPELLDRPMGKLVSAAGLRSQTQPAAAVRVSSA
jgi:myo-inositol-1(or 4)-monophosphatase